VFLLSFFAAVENKRLVNPTPKRKVARWNRAGGTSFLSQFSDELPILTLVNIRLHRELQLRGDFGSLREIILVEKDKKVFNRLQERVSYILDYKNFIIREGQDLFLNPEAEESANAKEGSIDAEGKRIERLLSMFSLLCPLSKSSIMFYYFGIKATVEQSKLKCERVDNDMFTGDIVDRIKERIASAELVIADITGNKPNVFYEAGYAEGLDKKTIYISQQRDIQFDVSTQHQILYDSQDIRSLPTNLENY
jgi:hypothetical protein